MEIINQLLQNLTDNHLLIILLQNSIYNNSISKTYRMDHIRMELHTCIIYLKDTK